LTTASTTGFPSFQENPFLQGICAAGVVVSALAAHRPDTIFDFFLENGCVAFSSPC
jgi:hypothetical protein